MTTRGALIVFSGLDGAGKSTQVKLLMSHLRAEGRQPIYFWARGGYTPLFNAMKKALRRVSRNRVVPVSGHTPQRDRAFSKKGTRRLWLAVALLDLLWVYALRVRYWRWRGKTVVCDRYIWDTLIDFQMNFPQEAVESWRLWRLLMRVTPRPNSAFLLLVPVEESIRRSDVKGEPFRDSPETLARRLAHYESMARAGRWQVLDGRRAADDLADEIQATVKNTGRASAGGLWAMDGGH